MFLKYNCLKEFRLTLIIEFKDRLYNIKALNIINLDDILIATISNTLLALAIINFLKVISLASTFKAD